MSRPKEFCVHAALSKALEVFWRHGFEGTSLSDLTDAMGITRPSLYATYGNKEELFRQALDLYDEAYMGFTHDALKEPNARSVVDRLLTGFALAQTDPRHPPGCLGTNGTLACSIAADPIRDEIVRRRASFETALRRRLDKAKAAGDLDSDASAGDLARYVMVVASGMAILASTGASRQSLKKVVGIALDAWPAKA